MKKPLYLAFPLALACLGLAACNPDFDSFGTPEPKPPEGDVETITFVFEDESDDWEARIADFNINDDTGIDFTDRFERLPEPLNNLFGLRLSGNDIGSGLFMFVKRRFIDFEPNTRYEVEFKLTIATNTPSGCAGSPGEDVFLKAGATIVEPVAEERISSGEITMNIDKGNTAGVRGSDTVVLGNIANDKSCDDAEADEFELKNLDSGNENFILETDADGDLWLMFGTDSDFEGNTTLYFVEGEVTLTSST